MNTIIVLSTTLSEDLVTAWAELSDGTDTYILPIGGIDPEVDLQEHLMGRWDRLWALAQKRGYTETLDYISERKLLKALVGVILNEVNLLRVNAGLPERTLDQLKTAINSNLV